MSVYLDEYTLGQEFTTPARTITEADVVNFGCLTGDLHPNHFDRVRMEQGEFGQRLVHGLLLLSVSHGLLFQLGLLRDSCIAFLGLKDWQFKAPVFFGDTIHCRSVVSEIRNSRSKPDRGVLKLAVEIIKQDGTVCQTGTKVLLMRRSRPGECGRQE